MALFAIPKFKRGLGGKLQPLKFFKALEELRDVIRGKYLYLCPQKPGGIVSKFSKVSKCFWHCEV